MLLEAKEADIPVILIDRRVDVEGWESCHAAWVGSVSIRKGREAGQDSGKTLGGHREDETIRIVILPGTDGSTAEILAGPGALKRLPPSMRTGFW